MTSCCFSGIYRDTTPLCTCSTENGNWDRVFLNMCEHGQVKDGTQIMNVNGYIWGILKEKEGLTFLIVCRNVNQQTVDESLQQLKSQFVRSNLNWKTAEQLSLMTAFEGKLSDFMRRVSTQGKLASIQANINETTDTMKSSYEEVLIRGINMENLTSLSDQLDQSATMYKEESTELKKAMCWRKYRFYVIGSIIVLIVLYVILVIICGGFDLKPRCIAENSSPTPSPTPAVD